MICELSVVIVNYNTRELLADCLESLRTHLPATEVEVIVVDNASSDGSREMVQTRFPEVRLICSKENLGFGRANNLGVQESSGKYLFLFNSDAVLREDTATALRHVLEERPETGVAGPRVLLSDNSRQPMICGPVPSLRAMFNDALKLDKLFPGIRFFQGLHDDRPTQRVTEVGWVSGVCMLIRRKAFEQVEGFDPEFFMYCEDIDLCLRMRRFGWGVVHVDEYPIVHHCGGSSKTDAQRLRNSLMQQRYFLRMLSRDMGWLRMAAARLILSLGLAFRIAAGAVQVLLHGRKKSLLLRSSGLRLAALWGCRFDVEGSK
ncbi:MAG: glycosyltransferase family 2 protein [Desulfovibrionaceae bacterium]